MTETKQQPKRRIRSIAFMHRVGSNPMQHDLDFVGERDAEFEAAKHPLYGPGVWVRWKERAGAHRFVPITNIRAIDEVEEDRNV